MAIVLWDASGFAKRYTQEAGSEAVNAIFRGAPTRKMFLTPWGYAETYSILLRKHNGGILDTRTFLTTTNALRSEVLSDSDFGLLTISDALVFGSLSLMKMHNVNSADAAILATYLRFQRTNTASCLLVASDKRLLRAAEAEGLKGLNPEEVAESAIPELLASF